eukprot:1161520-Pleurochrysis_carterae.AAC.1
MDQLQVTNALFVAASSSVSLIEESSRAASELIHPSRCLPISSRAFQRRQLLVSCCDSLFCRRLAVYRLVPERPSVEP